MELRARINRSGSPDMETVIWESERIKLRQRRSLRITFYSMNFWSKLYFMNLSLQHDIKTTLICSAQVIILEHRPVAI
jgi:hypothetical protein